MNDSASAFVSCLTGYHYSVMDWRVINDRNPGDNAVNIRGTLAEVYQSLQNYNAQGWGIFACIQAMDGVGRKAENVHYIRTHVVDLDNVLTSAAMYEQAINSQMPPHFAVQTSPGKYHLYWLCEPYVGNDFYTIQQRKLAQLYNGDEKIVDAPRVMRVPGFLHCKADPTPVTCWQISNAPRYTAESIERHLSGVNVVERVSVRAPLGDPELAAPSYEWLVKALNMLDPNDLDRNEWMATSAAFKQAGWTLASEDQLLTDWKNWCRHYTLGMGNSDDENMKLWKSLHDTQVGWSRFKRLTNVDAYMMFGEKKVTEEYPELLDATDKQKWFKDCYFIAREGKIFSPSGRFMNQTQFNGLYGGKHFLLTSTQGKSTDEPWKAALRSTDWTIPRVDHVRFMPHRPPYAIVIDELGRKGLNTYLPARIETVSGDISRWSGFLDKIFQTRADVDIFNAYLAHCIKFPGHKIPWAVLLQSERGIGKKMIGSVMKYCIGESYTYEPDAEQLVSGASRFNGWMRNKLMIIVDEIRVGDRRDLLEGLKKIITDERIAVESKGVDQEMEDNTANWLFFSNFKDAIPINENERRYAVFYSSLQTGRAIEASMDKGYFDDMYHWLQQEDGYKKLAHYYINYPVERGSLPHRAPKTSSYEEVLRIGRGPIEVILDEKIEAGERGFRGGYISWPVFVKTLSASPKFKHCPPEHTIRSILETRGYKELGYYTRIIGVEDMSRPPLLFGIPGTTVEGYEAAQI